MRTKQPDATRKTDNREALIFVGFAVLLLVLLALMLWMRSFTRLSEVEIYIGATVLAGSACLYRADSAWRQAKRIARRRRHIEERNDIALREKAAAESSTGGSWAKRIREES